MEVNRVDGPEPSIPPDPQVPVSVYVAGICFYIEIEVPRLVL